MTAKRIGLSCVAAYLPPERLTNDDLAKIVETNDEWITRRTGIRERRIARTMTTADMGTEAARAVLAQVPGAVDLVIGSTSTSECTCPNVSCEVACRLELGKIPAFDINMACSGFTSGIAMASSLMREAYSPMERAIVVASEKVSRIVDYSDRRSCILFGDGAAAAMITSVEPFHEILGWEIGGDPMSKDKLRYGGEGKDFYFTQDGQGVYKFAVSMLISSVTMMRERFGISSTDNFYLVPHQGNLRMLESISEKLEIPMDHIAVTVDRFGNTSSSSVGIALAEEQHKYKSGDYVMLVGFGGGLSWSAVMLRW